MSENDLTMEHSEPKTKSHITYPAKVIPLHKRGNNIPVAGSFVGASMAGSLPNGTAEHCAIEVSFLLRMLLSVAHSSPAARSRDADETGKVFAVVELTL